MKTLYIVIVLAMVVSVVFISGCIQTRQEVTPPVIGHVTEDVIEDQAFNTVDEEINNVLENMTMEDVEDALLQQ